MDLSPVSACFAIIVMALNGDYARRWRWAQVTILLASAGGTVVSLADRAWLFGVACLIAGMIAIQRIVRAP